MEFQKVDGYFIVENIKVKMVSQIYFFSSLKWLPMTHRSLILERQLMLLSPSIGILTLLSSSHHLTTLYKYERIQLLAQKLLILMQQIKTRYIICTNKWGSEWGLQNCEYGQIIQKMGKTIRVEKIGQKSYRDNFALSPDMYNN